MIKVSVIVPVYNTEKYLEKCLDSLVHQTLKEIEIIVVNDGSPDNSQKIIDKFVKKYPNVRGYLKKNGGLSDARNYGLKYASGEYIYFLDSDDYVDKDILKKMYTKAQEDNSDIVCCNYFYTYENKVNALTKGILKYSDDNKKNYLIMPPMVCIKFFKKHLLDKYKFKVGIYYEDLEFYTKIINDVNKVSFIDEELYYYFQRSGSIMNQKKFNNHLLDIFDVLEANKKILYKDYYLELEYIYITHLLRSGTLRFLDYPEGKKYLDKIKKIFKNDFPKWRKNIYYRQSGFKIKIICNLAYWKMYGFLKLIKKVTGK